MSISGNKECGPQGFPIPNDFPIDKDEGCLIEYNMDYNGGDITKKTTTNLQECSEFSVSVPEALFWTWNLDNKMCYIKGMYMEKKTYNDVSIFLFQSLEDFSGPGARSIRIIPAGSKEQIFGKIHHHFISLATKNVDPEEWKFIKKIEE